MLLLIGLALFVAAVIVTLPLWLRPLEAPEDSLCCARLQGEELCTSRMVRIRHMGWLGPGVQMMRCGRGHAWILRPALIGWKLIRWPNEDRGPARVYDPIGHPPPPRRVRAPRNPPQPRQRRRRVAA